jgi:UDP-2,3-diacylglucosamine pyrophosphatase LpxH
VEASTVASITDPVDAPLAAPDVPAKPLEDPEEGVPAELPEDDPDPGLPEEGPLPLLLLHAAQKAVATIDKATGRLRALDMVVLREKKTRRCISREVGAGLADLRGTCAHVAGYARAYVFMALTSLAPRLRSRVSGLPPGRGGPTRSCRDARREVLRPQLFFNDIPVPKEAPAKSVAKTGRAMLGSGRAPMKPILYALSDLHLQAPVEPFLFTKEKEDIFVRVASEADEAGATLLLAGDVFDLTGMTPPPKGLARFFRSAGVPAPPAPLAVDPSAQIERLKETFTDFFRCLRPLATQQRLRFLPGNHDCSMATSAGRQALAGAIGIAVDQLLMTVDFDYGGYFFACHGNQFDKSNLTDAGGGNTGSVITAALYHAVIPALDKKGFRQLGDAVPAVRPEENIVDGLEAHLGIKATGQLLLAFVELLLDNGYFKGLDEAKVWLATHMIPFLVTPADVRKALADDTDLKKVTREHALAILAGTEPAATPGAKPEVVVMGHTHELDGTESYVNLGTWIDHVRGLSPDDIACVDRSLPVLVVYGDGRTAALHDCRSMAKTVLECPTLWMRPAAPPTSEAEPPANS